ncbi:hypothetical protein HK405_009204 [Cladochytrium tenue]|nr:hypothetical protein HK405_009204 [Cladochytrium tenue]
MAHTFTAPPDPTSGHDLSERIDVHDLQDGLLDLNRLWPWLLCFCVVAFDLEDGQALEHVYPPVMLSPEERKNMWVFDCRSVTFLY